MATLPSVAKQSLAPYAAAMSMLRASLILCLSAAALLVQPRFAEAADDTAKSPAACPLPPAPVYVADWGRLADLTRADALVYSHAEFWAARRQSADWVLALGVAVGGGVAVLGTINWLIEDEWSKNNKRVTVGGAAVAAIALFANWTFAPDRDDLATVINQWNIRHPDRVLAP